MISLKLLRVKLFNPTDNNNRAGTTYMKKLGEITADTFIKEFQDTTKVTHMHLSELEGPLLFNECTTEHKDALIGMRAT